MIKTENNNLIVRENELYETSNIKVKSNVFEELMKLYSQAIEEVKNKLNSEEQYEIINHIKCRIKSPKSIIKKLNKKGYNLTYKNMIDNINDIAGVRIITKTVEDVYRVKQFLEEEPCICIIKEKDYIEKPKKSGYSSLHLIVEVPVAVKEQVVFVKVEIQIRTMAMDMWANLEHEIKYKPQNRISKISSIKLVNYAKILNRIEREMSEMYNGK